MGTKERVSHQAHPPSNAPVHYGIHTSPDSSIRYRTDIEPPQGRLLSLADYYTEDAPERFPELTKVLDEFLVRNGVRRAFAPSVRFTRTVVHPRELTTRIKLPSGIDLFRNKDIPADAVCLPEPGDAFLMSNAGCAAIAMVCEDRMIAGHGGMDALIDRDFVLRKKISDDGSIVDSMVKALFAGRKPQTGRTSCRAFYNVAKQSFEYLYSHEIHGKYNSELESILKARYGAHENGMIVHKTDGFVLDQGLLIGAQAHRHRLHRVSTCIEPLKPNGPYATTRHNNERMRTLRNLILVVRDT